MRHAIFWRDEWSKPQRYLQQIVDAHAVHVRIRHVPQILALSRGRLGPGAVGRQRGQDRMGQMEGKNCQICEEMNAAMHSGQWSRAPLSLKRFVFKVKWVMVERWCFPGESDWGLGVPARAEAVLGALRGIVDFYTRRYRSGPRRDIEIGPRPVRQRVPDAAGLRFSRTDV